MSENSDHPICLIVDDSEFDRRAIARAVKRSDLPYRLRIASTLSELEKCVGHKHVKALILDNSLPDGRGIDFAVKYVAHPWFRGLSKVIVTDFPSPFIFEKARQADVGEVMLKSELSPEAIRIALRRRSRFA